jgi:tRNA (adenine57-N1/adenine58-N1)-methyltransferase
VGHDEGSVVRSSLNEPFWVFRPSLPQLIPNLPRAAQVVYPKDIGPILIWADLFPGARVIEAGVGAGALSIALLRAVGSDGQLISYEIRKDFAEMARKNLTRYFGPAPNWTVKIGDVAAQLEETDIDRMILDLPEPGRLSTLHGRPCGPAGSYFATYLRCFK